MKNFIFILLVGTVLSASSVSVVEFTDDAIVLKKYGVKKHRVVKRKIRHHKVSKRYKKKVSNDALVAKDELNLRED